MILTGKSNRTMPRTDGLCLLVVAAVLSIPATGTEAVRAESPRQIVKGPFVEDPPDDRAQLRGKWIVRAVKIDGKPTPAQIGREVGDIITIKIQGDRLVLS